MLINKDIAICEYLNIYSHTCIYIYVFFVLFWKGAHNQACYVTREDLKLMLLSLSIRITGSHAPSSWIFIVCLYLPLWVELVLIWRDFQDRPFLLDLEDIFPLTQSYVVQKSEVFCLFLNAGVIGMYNHT